MPTKQEREAVKAQKLAEKQAKEQAKIDAKVAKDKEKADKKAAKEAEKLAKKEGNVTKEEGAVARADVVAEPELKKNVQFEGATVEEVLKDGRETETAFHCRMSDGTTKHVPKALFVV